MTTESEVSRGSRAEVVAGKDGTPIAYWRSGGGPPLVLVHGAAADHGRWSPVLPAFEERFTVYAVDRRGRGGSGDSDEYAIEREIEDVAAVVASIGEPVALLGHSYGALLALEAARVAPNVRKLVLYEPTMDLSGAGIFPPGVVGRMEAMLDEGDRDGVIVTTMREIAGLSPEVVEYMRSQPVWKDRVAAAHTIPRELRANEAYRFDSDLFGNLASPTLLLLGENSPAIFRDAEKAVDDALPDSRIVAMPGQGHSAMDTATDLFTTEVSDFLTTG